MDHAYLSALMRGEIPNGGKPKKTTVQPKVEEPKSKLISDMEKQISSYVDGVDVEEYSGAHDHLGHGSLLPAKAKKEKLKLELQEAAKLPQLTQQIECAINIIYDGGSVYLSQEAYEKLLAAISGATEKFAGLSLDDLATNDLQRLGNIDESVMQSIVDIAVAKFTEERFGDCLALFTLLAILNPLNPEYAFRQGIAAQKDGDFELATRAYAAASELNPNLIGAYLLSAQCNIELKLWPQARDALTAAKEIASTGDVDSAWLEVIPTIEADLRSH